MIPHHTLCINLRAPNLMLFSYVCAIARNFGVMKSGQVDCTGGYSAVLWGKESQDSEDKTGVNSH